MRFAGQLIALGLLLANREKRHPRRIQTERHARIHAAHHRELKEVLRPALDAGADVQQDRRVTPRRNRRREGGAVDARQHAEGAMRGHDGGARVPGTEERRRLATGHQVGCDLDRGVRLPPQRRRRRLGHVHDGAGVDDTDVLRDSAALVPFQLGVQPLGGSDKGDAQVEVPRRREGTLDDVPRRLVASHGVDGNPNH